MSGHDYASDVSALALAVQPMIRELPPLEAPWTSGSYLLEMHVSASRSGHLLAAQQALQLAFDAAAIALFHAEAAHDVDLVERALRQPDVVLNLMWAGSGSLRQVFVVNPLTEDGRSNVRYLFYVGFLVLGCVPGGQGFALAYGLALETLLLAARVRERVEEGRRLRLRTLDESALQHAPTRFEFFPPGRSWHPPGRSEQGWRSAEDFAELRDRIAALEVQAQRDRATINRLRMKLERGTPPTR